MSNFPKRALANLPVICDDATDMGWTVTQHEPSDEALDAREYEVGLRPHALHLRDLDSQSGVLRTRICYVMDDMSGGGHGSSDRDRSLSQGVDYVAEYTRKDIQRVEFCNQVTYTAKPQLSESMRRLLSSESPISEFIKATGDTPMPKGGAGDVVYDGNGNVKYENEVLSNIVSWRSMVNSALPASDYSRRICELLLMAASTEFREMRGLVITPPVQSRVWSIPKIPLQVVTAVRAADIEDRSYIFVGASEDPVYYAALIMAVAGRDLVDADIDDVWWQTRFPSENTIDKITLVCVGSPVDNVIVREADFYSALNTAEALRKYIFQYTQSLGLYHEVSTLAVHVSVLPFLSTLDHVVVPYSDSRPLADLLPNMISKSEETQGTVFESLATLLLNAPLVVTKLRIAIVMMHYNYPQWMHMSIKDIMATGAAVDNVTKFAQSRYHATFRHVLGPRLGGLHLLGLRHDARHALAECLLVYARFAGLICQFYSMPNAILAGLLGNKGINMNGDNQFAIQFCLSLANGTASHLSIEAPPDDIAGHLNLFMSRWFVRLRYVGYQPVHDTPSTTYAGASTRMLRVVRTTTDPRYRRAAKRPVKPEPQKVDPQDDYELEYVTEVEQIVPPMSSLFRGDEQRIDWAEDTAQDQSTVKGREQEQDSSDERPPPVETSSSVGESMFGSATSIRSRTPIVRVRRTCVLYQSGESADMISLGDGKECHELNAKGIYEVNGSDESGAESGVAAWENAIVSDAEERMAEEKIEPSEKSATHRRLVHWTRMLALSNDDAGAMERKDTLRHEILAAEIVASASYRYKDLKELQVDHTVARGVVRSERPANVDAQWEKTMQRYMDFEAGQEDEDEEEEEEEDQD